MFSLQYFKIIFSTSPIVFPNIFVTVSTPGPELHLPRPSSECAMESQLPFLVHCAGLWAGTCRRPRLNT